MEKRRRFLKTMLGALAGMGFWFNPLFRAVRTAYAKAQKVILPRDTTRESLILKDPGELDTRNLEPTPLKEFGSMGLSDHHIDLSAWRLEIAGEMAAPLTLTYSELIALAPVERKVLLICPGFFVNHGRWKGISLGRLLEKAQMAPGVTHVTISGPAGRYEKTERFPLADVLSDKVFLATAVNGETLPPKHGYPLRVVAEGFYGSDWVKYVSNVRLDKV